MITPVTVQGTWTFSVWGEVRGRNVSRQQQLDLVMVELPDTVYLRYEDQEVKCGLCSLEISTDTPPTYRCEMMTGSAPSPRGWGASPWSAWRRAAAPSPASASSPGAATSPRSRARAAGSYISIYDSCLFMYLL